ncbi:MAG: dolichyl-phosphate beta-glucosyltransferase [Patescibacteria group bacterium]|nr:dolichyl-phosphate beta-glucosyltransferase [Patescibacteria group bacterium]
MEEEIYLSVIVPAYNEEKLIKNTLSEIENFLFAQAYSYEIIVVDDGSRDKTSSILEELRVNSKKLTIIKNNRNKGKGYSVRRAMLFANGKFRLFMDADNSTSINQLANFIPFLEGGWDVVIGSRALKDSKIKEHQSFCKELLGGIGNKLIKFFAISEIDDTQCGFKCFSSESAQNIFSRLTIDRWGFDIEILAIVNKFNYKIKAVPVNWENRKETKVRKRDYLFTFKELLKIKINLLTKKYDK